MKKHLKRLKEADQVEASIGEDFKEDPKFKSAEHRLGLQESKLLPNLNFYKGVQLKNKVFSYNSKCTFVLLRHLEILQVLLHNSHECSHVRHDLLLEDLCLVLVSSKVVCEPLCSV